jgi:predicted TIM-barrel fold metal-dependent hydrolase
MSDTRLEIIDTHQHLWDLDRFRYSWCASIPKLNHSFLMSDYVAAAAKLPRHVRISKTIHVEADVDDEFHRDETRWILSLADAPDNPLSGVVASCRPEREDFRDRLEPFIGQPKLKGLRRVLHTQPDDLSTSDLFSKNLQSLPALGLSFDLCILPRQLPNAINLVGRCPETSFILDHCAVPDVKNQSLDPWRERIRQLSRLPNLAACKISGLVAYADPSSWTPKDLRPFIDHAIECFGWDRVIFGSDWPVCTLSATLAQWVDAAIELTGSATNEQRDKLFRRNAERVYRLK